MKRRFLMILALVLTVTLGASGQVIKGSAVKRITFDQEKVNIEYITGRVVNDFKSKELVVLRDNRPTDVQTVKPTQVEGLRRWYTPDGRVLQGEPRKKGVYILIESDGTKKTIIKK